MEFYNPLESSIRSLFTLKYLNYVIHSGSCKTVMQYLYILELTFTHVYVIHESGFETGFKEEIHPRKMITC